MTPLRIFAIKATHNVDFARFSQPLNGFPHCFQHIVESAVEKKREDSSSELPCTRTSCVCFFHKSDHFVFPLFPSAHLDFPRFFPHLYVFHSTKFPLFPLLFAFPHFHIFSACILWKGNVPACKGKPAFPQTHILYYYYTFSYFYFFSSFFCKQKSSCPPVENTPSINANEKRTKYQTRLRFASCNAGTSERGFAP